MAHQNGVIIHLKLAETEKLISNSLEFVGWGLGFSEGAKGLAERGFVSEMEES